MIRIDMSEYMEKHAVARLIGAPPGYVGYEEGGQLTEAVRRRPYSVVLFDEIEKAHHDVFNVLLQILDDGRLTDSQGRTVDFKNTVLIMTSNIGSQALQAGRWRARSELDEARADEVMDALRGHFRPEFLNRVDEIVHLRAAAQRGHRPHRRHPAGAAAEAARGQAARRWSSPTAAASFLAERGYDPVYGARPLKRAIQKYLQDPLALKVLSGEFVAGDTVLVDAGKDALRFGKPGAA